MKRLPHIALLALGLVLAGCASFPQKKSADDCLVVIKVQASNPDSLRWARLYRLEFSLGYPGVNVPNNESDVVFIVREPSVRVTKIVSRVPDGNYVGAASEQPLDFVVPYEPGRVVVADFCIVRRLEKTGTNSGLEYFNFAPLSDTDRAAAREELMKKKRFAAWEAK